MDKVHQSFLEIDQKDSKSNEIDQGQKDGFSIGILVQTPKEAGHVEDKEEKVKDTSQLHIEVGSFDGAFS